MLPDNGLLVKHCSPSVMLGWARAFGLPVAVAVGVDVAFALATDCSSTARVRLAPRELFGQVCTG